MSSHDGDSACGEDPFAWFKASFERASTSESFDAARAALATVSPGGQPSVRFVLVKQVDERGFVFFTNFNSCKARDLAATPRAALAYHWSSIGEQVRVEGAVVRVEEAEADAYFASRPRGSQLGAWASAQSTPIASRGALDQSLTSVTERFAAHEQVPRPPHWGGFRVVPSSIEFWRDRRDRMHDRIAFTRDRDPTKWLQTRLQP
jgi:pyridoxamine 5'-phosphate oxidase